MEDFNQFLIKLHAYLATGKKVVKVVCSGDKVFEADVIGYSETYMQVEVKFHRDDLSKPGTREVPVPFGYGTEPETEIQVVNVPVKVEKFWWESIEIPDQI